MVAVGRVDVELNHFTMVWMWMDANMLNSVLIILQIRLSQNFMPYPLDK